ncbi:transglycosylase SLT domain-containing protein [Acinetobacter larvae]|uniref:ABC transporter substrate-binding protein n=1 Tax=Acinetobacter larvae TaxID=1789224 RepID=A0A1B2LY76_9GAMM|nr:transglycosylase SLT domain-containing protein [Acinetobacter larvae]AOA57891.1 ABC transporter substrate-binding protein [Acinetobacter larvae]
MHSSSTSGSRRCLYSRFTSNLPKFLVIASLAAIPFHGSNANRIQSAIAPTSPNKLTVVTVASPSTVLNQDDFRYGFGYDLVYKYAQSTDLQLDLHVVADNDTALQWVKQGKANLAMTTQPIDEIKSKRLRAISVSCDHYSILSQRGLDHNLNWVAAKSSPQIDRAQNYLCDNQQSGNLQQLASFYDRNVVSEDEWLLLNKMLHKRMPIYRASLERTAENYALDWHLLTAIALQESQLNPQSVSPTGVRGVMMLTHATAKAMGVHNRLDPEQSIRGGAKYYDLMLQKYQDIALPDRYWFALVAYNMGPGAVDKIQQQLQQQGKDPQQWTMLYDYLNRHQAQHGRYKQAIQYVTRIRSYLERIKTNSDFVEV